MFKKYDEFINEASMDNFQMYLTKLADHLGDRQLARDAKTKSYLKSMFKKDTDYQKFTDDEIKNLSGEELHNMIKYDKRFNENVNEKAIKGKDAGNFIKMAKAGKKLTMNDKTYTALGKGKWKGPDGDKLNWIEVSSMASALGNKEVMYEAKVTAKTIDKLTNEISKLTKDLKDNFAKYKSAKTDEDKAKYMKIAGELTGEKKAKDSELEMAIQNFGADMELDMSFESKVNEDGHTDVASAKRKLKTAMEDAAQILQKLESMESEGDLPSWWMGKITLASDYLNKSRDYLLYPDMNENKYDTALDKMDKWLPADPDAQERYYEILNQENWKDMLDFFMANGSMGDLARYGIKSDRDLEKLAKLAMESYGPVTAQRLNESTNRIL
tara:strand:+ start:71 stop:1222 length:1152 start_codon:yes stop_codon:yes gene_type:complete